jgi:hypothetical protein
MAATICRARGWSIISKASSAGSARPGLGADQPAEKNDAVLVGDGRDGVDDLHRWRVAQQAEECRPRFPPAHAPEGAAGCNGHVGVAVLGQIKQERAGRWPWTGAAAGIGAHLGIGMLQEGQDRLGGHRRLEPGGDGDGDLPRRALDDVPGDQSGHRLRRLRAADQVEGVERCDLLGHRPLEAEAREAQAELLQGRDRGVQPAPSRFGREGWSLRQARKGDRCDERVVVEIGRRRFLSPTVWLRRAFRRDAACRKEIELPLGHRPSLTRMTHPVEMARGRRPIG